ncbi:unnamed protein product [Mytilus edulis]|uniref:C-type lectin domain-containing protein n=1 Tax=Mytilus edulis TaxID=6550 RepID=A0A8S3QDI4_MYTED|nr:unnamed protein product [Mytilus edulis]
MGFILLANQTNSADCYFYDGRSELWEKAKLICASTPGAYLWRPNTIQEANDVRDQIFRTRVVWTGANDRDKDGNYIFDIENSPFSKTSVPFGSGLFRNEAELVYVDIQYDYNFATWLWKNQNSNYRNSYLCEYQRTGKNWTSKSRKGEACSHIAALLFAIDDFVSKGLKELPADQTGTEKLCTWNRQARRKIEPKKNTRHTNCEVRKFLLLFFTKMSLMQEHGKSPKERDTLASLNFDPRHPADRHLNQGALKQLYDALTSANPTCGFMKYHKIILTDKIEPESLDPLHTVRNFNDFTLLPSIKEIREAGLYFKSTLKLDQNGINELEFSTRSQSNSSAWHSAKRFRITASTFHKIGFRRKKTDPTCLLKTLLYNVRKPTKDMLFYLQQDEPSITRFVQELEKRGKMGLNVQKRDLIL